MERKDLEKAISLMNKNWQKQNNFLDRKTNFIYDVVDFSHLTNICKRVLSKKEDRQYALHRWVNLQISEFCEECFCKYGAKKVKNKKDKEKDIFIENLGYDVKVTNYPKTAYEEFNLKEDCGKQDLGTWFYNNQSREGREHYKNRLFVVCCGTNPWKSRLNLDLLEYSIKNFMENFKVFFNKEYNCYFGIIIIEE